MRERREAREREQRPRQRQRQRPQRQAVQSTGVVSRGGGPVIARRDDPIIARGGDRAAPVRRGGGAGIVRLLVVVGLLGAAYWALGAYRHELIERVPQSFPILKALGFEVEEPLGYGIRITSRADRVPGENRQWFVHVSGTLRNGLDKRVSVPRLRITITSRNARPITWTVVPDAITLEPGERANFSTRYATPYALLELSHRVRFERR
jgi:hypothetical protein